MRNQLFTLAVFTTAILAAGCSRQEAQPPAAQVQTQTPAQQLNTPETVTGCLRAGEGPDTFVVTTSQTQDGRPPMTYEIANNTSGVNLTDHVGHRVSLQGVVREQQAATSATTSAPATDKPRGTSGAPTVQTTATLQVRRIEVSQVNRAAGDCEK